MLKIINKFQVAVAVVATVGAGLALVGYLAAPSLATGMVVGFCGVTAGFCWMMAE